MLYTLQASKRWATVTLGPFDSTSALRRAVELYHQGYTNLQMTDADTGETTELEQWLHDINHR